MDPQSQFGLASVKFLHGSQIVICNPQMEMPDASISICGSLREALWWSISRRSAPAENAQSQRAL